MSESFKNFLNFTQPWFTLLQKTQNITAQQKNSELQTFQ